MKTIVVTACILSALMGAAITFAAMTAISNSRKISSTAKVTTINVRVYKYLNRTPEVTSIDWGTLDPGETANFSCYIFNDGNAPMTLSLATESWNPTNASSQISLSWNYPANTPVPVSGAVATTFSLAVSPAISGITDFSFTIVITGSG